MMRYFKMIWFVVLMGMSFGSIAGNYEDALNYEKDHRFVRKMLAFEKAAIEDNNVDAMVALGNNLMRLDNYDRAFPFIARAAYLGNAEAQAMVGMLCSREVRPCYYAYGSEIFYPWAYMWYVLAGDDATRNMKKWDAAKVRDELIGKMTADERAEGEKLALEFREFIKAKQVAVIGVSGVVATSGAAEYRGTEYCPSSWKKYQQGYSLCDPFRSISYSLENGVRGTEVRGVFKTGALREEDVEFDNRKRKEAHLKDLREGVIPIADIKDAWLAQERIADLAEVMFSPLIKPDNKIYGAKLVLDSEGKGGTLRVRWDLDAFNSIWSSPLEDGTQEGMAKGAMRLSQLRAKYGGAVYYAELNKSSKTTVFSDNLRIGNSVWVIGRYVANKKYRKVNRTEGTMPVLDVLYIGE